MDGFPPRPETQVTLANWRTSPFNRWAFHHVREILPSADIAHDPAKVRELPLKPAALEGLRVSGVDGEALTLRQALEATSTDGLVVLHKGAIALEYYANGMTARSPHILMSVSKSMLGLLAGILADRGVLDLSRLVTDIIPEVKATAWAGATVGQLLDMRVGLAFDEDYLATSGAIVSYRKSTGWNPLEPGETPLGPARVSGQRYADLMSELLWQRIGAADSAYITVDRLGAPRAAGGMCATTRDLARVGQMMVEGGTHRGRHVVPEAWIETITHDGDSEAWDAGTLVTYFPGITMHYRAKWYVERTAPPLLLALGIHGQNLFVDRRNAVVVAKLSCQAAPLNAELIALTRRLVSELRRALATAT